MNNEPYGWHCFIGKGKEEQDFLFINGKGASKPDASWDKVISLYTQQYERPHNTVLVPCGKLAEMQAEIKALKAELEKSAEVNRLLAEDIGYEQ